MLSSLKFVCHVIIFSEWHVLASTHGQVRGKLVRADHSYRRMYSDRVDLRSGEVLSRHSVYDRQAVQAVGVLLERYVASDHTSCSCGMLQDHVFIFPVLKV